MSFVKRGVEAPIWCASARYGAFMGIVWPDRKLHELLRIGFTAQNQLIINNLNSKKNEVLCL